MDTTTSAVTLQTTLLTGRGRRVLLLLCAVAFLDFVDASITNVALPHIQSALGFSIQSLQWVPSAYLLTYGGFMLLGGRLADLLGRRDVLIAGATVVGLSSLVGGFAGNEGIFIAARLAQGLGAALMLPAALSALTTTFTSAKDRSTALGVWGAVAGLSSAAGILLGGVLTEGPGWRWVMFVNPIACAAVIPAVLALLPRDRPAARSSRFDLLGSLVVTSGMLLLVYALVKAPDQGWGSTRTVLELVGAGVLLAGFIGIESLTRDPVLPLAIFRVRGLAAANLTGLIGFAGMISMFYFLTLYMQNVLGYSPMEAGAAYLPLTFGVGISAGIASQLIPRIGSRVVISAGALISAGGLALLSQIPVDGGYLAHVLPGTLVVAFGLGPVFVGVTTAANAGVEADRAGLAAAILNSAQQIGGALGLAIFSAVGTARVHHLLASGTAVPEATTSGLRHALAAGAVFAAAAAAIAWATKNTFEEVGAVEEPRRVLIVGRSPEVLLRAVELLRERGYDANATNQFDDVLTDYDVAGLDVLVFGGMVPLDSKAHLRQEASRLNPDLTILQGLAGIAEVIVAQVESVSAPSAAAATFDAEERVLRLALVEPGRVKVEARWATFHDLALTSNVLTIVDTRLGGGDHVVPVPAEVPDVASFATVTVDSSVSVIALGGIPETIAALVPATASENRLPEVEAVRTTS
jgi:EmrB/QacA subfamily drug resistance transporter